MAELARKGQRTRTRSIAFCGLTIALFSVCAWISVPLGPVPFTLQTFAMVFALIALSPGQCMASIACYLAIGAIGIPVFSSMRGGIGIILGPTGGFLWGYLIGALIALALIGLLSGKIGMGKDPAEQSRKRAFKGFEMTRRRELAVSFAGAAVFIVTMYVFGCFQFMAVTGTGLAAAIATSVAPFIIVDLIKTVIGVLTALAVKRAIR